jgi:hypothetical protein
VHKRLPLFGLLCFVQKTGKLVDLPDDGNYNPDGGESKEEEKTKIPGYTGFIRGSQHIRGRTYGETTRRTASLPYRELASASPIPSNPQHSTKIRQDKLKHTFVGNQFGDKVYHVPGYTGFVPTIKDKLGQSFGNATSEAFGTTTLRASQYDSLFLSAFICMSLIECL